MLQVLVFSNIKFISFINPYVFPLFILLLPFETPRWLLMLLGFASGLSLDLFLDSGGMHAGACLLIGYLRPFLISIITPKGSEFEISPNIYAQGLTWFAVYLGVGTTVYLGYYFLLEAATFYNLFFLLLKIILSVVMSVVFMLIFLYLFSSRKQRRFA